MIPTDWSVFSIGALFAYLCTASNSRADLGETGVVAYVHYGDIHTRLHHFIDFSRDKCPFLLAGYSVTATRLRDGDLIVADASEDEAGVGKSVEVRNLGEIEAVSGLHTFLLRAKDRRIHAGYRGYLLEKEPVKRQLRRLATGLKVFGISKRALRNVLIPLPSPAEQGSIAEALSDVDGLLRSLDALIAKKRAIKRAAMQQLLTGKTRLPGFSGAWERKTLREVADIKNGATPSTQISAYWNGPIPWCIPTDITATPGKYLLATARQITAEGLASCAASLLPVGALLLCSRATIGEIKIAASPVCTNQGFKSLVCKDNVSNEFLYYLLLTLKPQMIERAIGSTFLEIGKRDVASIELSVPTYAEQRTIAAILSDMDAEIAVLERRRDKARAVKRGMMQQLLTGRVRLTQPKATEKRRTPTASVRNRHSWQFNEAVIISVLAKRFGDKQYPLGRMRYTKLLYLHHRHKEGHVEGFMKKAAGPYNPGNRYRGPEKIALQKSYIRLHRSGNRQGFVADANIDEAERYFGRWYDDAALEWLEQFRFEKNEHLEHLTTVDMAAEELRSAGKAVSVSSVKAFLRGEPEWRAKLARPAFSDAKLAGAIADCRALFGVGEER